MPEDYYIGWGTLALINAGLAQSKNRRRLNWFVLSLLIGPIATLLIVVWDNRSPDPTISLPLGYPE
ncbi:hypothetical protein [Paenibacillus sp. M-152]|uniref:hypothetical protein n=1 Tax=Paenibacillus sp. M-152 TaxID=2487928 RepID=UPI000F6E007A|nr:hypothetical protein [Paenibacillus sp. M-152]AZH31624.1 hypothetical protein EGM68_24170 [Paenibacillus sp. M-152]